MNHHIRPARLEDLDQILEIYSQARKFMAENGNPTQWAADYPSRQMLSEDIQWGHLYVVEDQGICGVFCFIIGIDPTYGYIEGAWASDSPYGTIHRIASVGGGVFGDVLTFCRSLIDHIRIDTHRDNAPMRHLVAKHGFTQRGIIYVADGTPRIAFDLQ